MKHRVCGVAFVLAMGWTFTPAPAVDVVHTGGDTFRILDSDGVLLSFKPLGYKPRYQWMGTRLVEQTREDDTLLYTYSQDKGNLDWTLRVDGEKNRLSVSVECSAKKDIPLTYLAMTFRPEAMLDGGMARLTTTKGETKQVQIPLRPSDASDVERIEFLDKAGRCLADIRLDTPAALHIHGDVRVELASEKIAAGQKVANRFTIAFGDETRIYGKPDEYPAQTDHSTWFAFKPTSCVEPGAIGMQDWMVLPKSPLTLRGGDVLRDGKPIKIWGTNVEYHVCAPRKKDAEKRAAFFAKYGVNGVRLHKLTNPGWEGLGSRESASLYDQDSLDRFDYFTTQLRKRGIVYGLSPIWDLHVFDGDKDKLVAYDEIKKKGDTTGLVWFAEDVQDLHIETLLNLLTHHNPYSDLRYAEDPAVAYVELQNEEDVFFYTVIAAVKRCPTYHRMVAEQFSDWLKAKYGSQEKLAEAWGNSALNTFTAGEGAFPNESLEQRNIFPVCNPWFWDNQGKTGRRAKRLQDAARFLYDCQNRYYDRATKAIRKAGYRGPIVCSNWQAGSSTGHFLNLASDAKFGMIDRHNYLGGSQGNPAHQMLAGHTLANHTGLIEPGSALLSVGMQQVADRPFVFSEWEAVVPVEWAAADTALVAAYGFGLQDWDMSYHFASNGNGFTPKLDHKNKKFNNLTPVGFGLYPVLSRMVLRGDVKPGRPVATRRLTVEQAVTQTYDFTNTTVQQHDIKSFSGTPSHQALAVGRVLIDFGATPEPSTIGDWEAFREGDTITSNTGQLKWTAPGDKRTGFFTIDTPGTQGVVGFIGDRTFQLGDMSIKTQDPYGVILATAHSPKGTLATDKQVLIVAIARAHNTGMNMSEDMIFSTGQSPVLLEPLTAAITFERKAGTVTVLDHDGMPTDHTYRIQDGRFRLDTGRDKAMYYLVEFDR